MDCSEYYLDYIFNNFDDNNYIDHIFDFKCN